MAFAVGQILGPLLVRVLGPAAGLARDGLAWVNAAATMLLALTAAGWLWRAAQPSHTALQQD